MRCQIMGIGVGKVFGIRPLPSLVGGVSKLGFDLFPLQPRRGVISVEPLWTPTQNPVGVTSTTFDKIFTHPVEGFRLAIRDYKDMKISQ